MKNKALFNHPCIRNHQNHHSVPSVSPTLPEFTPRTDSTPFDRFIARVDEDAFIGEPV